VVNSGIRIRIRAYPIRIHPYVCRGSMAAEDDADADAATCGGAGEGGHRRPTTSCGGGTRWGATTSCGGEIEGVVTCSGGVKMSEKHEAQQLVTKHVFFLTRHEHEPGTELSGSGQPGPVPQAGRGPLPQHGRPPGPARKTVTGLLRPVTPLPPGLPDFLAS
jgi:hypothetical protein